MPVVGYSTPCWRNTPLTSYPGFFDGEPLAPAAQVLPNWVPGDGMYPGALYSPGATSWLAGAPMGAALQIPAHMVRLGIA